ncbi:tetratricopeptide repeat protein [Flavobacterium sp.]|uniref:type IX secretion system periplasmic lipoprotein PorW/SprE n=1 Tax=Flavobacterium sp. TaxID=239 RepID=UPI0037A0668E
MKTNTYKYTFILGFLFFLIACSTKRDTFLARNSHALSTEYNILFNGQIGLDKGIKSIESKNKDNFWKRLPIEKMQFIDDNSAAPKPKNADFELAEAKATKAIQKHSMNIDGRERNMQMDEAYLMLGKARYYDQRFIPAIDAFNYILYKYTNSDKIYEARIWREKTNMRLGNDEQVIKNINKLLDQKKLKNQVVANANALLSEAFLNLEQTDSALAKLKIAEKYTKINTERARYRFILGQLYQELGKKDSALYSYQSVIAMNRKSSREFVIQAYAKKAQLFDYEKGDANTFIKTFNKLVADRENRPFLDVIYYEMGVFYDKRNDQKLASKYYNSSLKRKSSDNYLVASDYRNIGNMHFKNAEYPLAAKYYDSTLVKLETKTREYIHIKKVRKDLDEVIEYELVAKTNDSILKVVSLTEADRVLYYENYIEKLKKADIAKKKAEEKEKQRLENIARNSKVASADPAFGAQSPGKAVKKAASGPPSIADASINAAASAFYFYNPTTVAYGKVEFKKRWGDRALNGNWRQPTNAISPSVNDTINKNKPAEENKLAEDKIPEKYTTDFYLKQLPKTQVEIDKIAKERNVAYYELGVIYKEKFKEYQLATNRLELLLQQNPEEKLILPAMYNLYKTYQITNVNKAEAMKARISSQYSNSRYAQIINNANPTEALEKGSPENIYNKWYKLYQGEQFVTVLGAIDELINQFSGDEIVSKFELLKANTIGKLKGLEAYKKAMQYVADTYPKSEEGKNAKEILTTQIPFLEKMSFDVIDKKNWKVLYKVADLEGKSTADLQIKISKLFGNEIYKELFFTCENYSEKESFVMIQGINSEAYAKTIVSILKDKYKITEAAIIISDENYKIVQIKKNLEEYLAPPKTIIIPNQQAVSQPLNTNQDTPLEKFPPIQNPNRKDKINTSPNSPKKP